MFPVSSQITSLQYPPERASIRLRFEEMSSTELAERISQIPNAQVILWYLGSHKMKEHDISFYQSKVSEILEETKSTRCWTVDLNSWENFFCGRGKSKLIEGEKNSKLEFERLKCIEISRVLAEIQALNEDDGIFAYFKSRIVEKVASEDNLDSYLIDAKLVEVFARHSLLLSDLLDVKTGIGFSVVHYLESCFCIKDVLLRSFDDQNPINIVFCLPKEQLFSFNPDTDKFLEDLQKLISPHLDQSSGEVNITVFGFDIFSKYLEPSDHFESAEAELVLEKLKFRSLEWSQIEYSLAFHQKLRSNKINLDQTLDELLLTSIRDFNQLDVSKQNDLFSKFPMVDTDSLNQKTFQAFNRESQGLENMELKEFQSIYDRNFFSILLSEKNDLLRFLTLNQMKFLLINFEKKLTTDHFNELLPIYPINLHKRSKKCVMKLSETLSAYEDKIPAGYLRTLKGPSATRLMKKPVRS